jgi:N-acetylmuramoyl-L-alanine amidase
VVFVSIHADSLHPSVRGAMVYVAARSLRVRSFRAGHRALKGHEEYRDHSTVRIDSEFAARSEASSRYMAGRIIESLVRNDIAVHPNKPVRDRIFRSRGKGAWAPAVLKYSLAQNAVLVECANLANAEDRANVVDAEWRQQFSLALVEGLVDSFSPTKHND